MWTNHLTLSTWQTDHHTRAKHSHKLQFIAGPFLHQRTTAILQPAIRGTGVRCLSIRPLTQISQKPLHGSRSNFVESDLSAISPDFFFSKILIFRFLRLCFVCVNMGPYGSQSFRTLLLHSFGSIPNFTINMIIMVDIGCYLFGDLPKNINAMALWNFCQHVQDDMGLGSSKRYSSYSFHLMSGKLYADIDYHGGIQASTFLSNRQNFKSLRHFEILTWESM